MSVLKPSSDNLNKPYKNSFHWRNGSDELDVFEAAGYFSSTVNDLNPGNITSSFPKIIRQDVGGHHHVQKPGRMSLDMNMSTRNAIPAEFHKESGKKYKQPSSPGGRLASFLNSLFHQASLKKKKPKSGAGAGGAAAVEEEARRKRRSSISHFRVTMVAAADDSKTAAFSSSSGSGFRTPPPYANTPTKAYKEFRELSERRQAAEYLSGNCKNEVRKGKDWEDRKFRTGDSRFLDRDSWDLRNFGDGDDDGGDSDSSSDLFDLPNHELDFYSRDLPVYGTTHMDSIKMGAPISSVTT